MTKQEKIVDIFVIGGGVNGCGIARDAAGRGLKVELAEMNDLGSGTSSAATKLFHGGLRYLEYFEFRLVKEALLERETLLRAMPHISWPMRFVLPYHRDMRFVGDTPTSRLLSLFMPWMKGRRPAWLIRLGLFIYDHLGGRKILPSTTKVNLRKNVVGDSLQKRFSKAYEYSDCWVQDSRLVALNARAAKESGAIIRTRAKVISATQTDGIWRVVYEDATTGEKQETLARVLVNAGGPWVDDVIRGVVRQSSGASIRLVRGSHIVTRKLFSHDKCYFFQGEDGRIIFAIPYEKDFTLIGTTDVDHDSTSAEPVCSEGERDYLLAFASQYFEKPVKRVDVVWSYSGIRPLFDNDAGSAAAATRDYVLSMEQVLGAPILNIFGGKITTYRKLAEAALSKITPFLEQADGPWTAGKALPGGEFEVGSAPKLVKLLLEKHPFLGADWAERLIYTYGTDAQVILQDAFNLSDLGAQFSEQLFEREVRWLIENEFARTAEDIVWRRTKLGLRMTKEEVDRLDRWIVKNGFDSDAAERDQIEVLAEGK